MYVGAVSRATLRARTVPSLGRPLPCVRGFAERPCSASFSTPTHQHPRRERSVPTTVSRRHFRSVGTQGARHGGQCAGAVTALWARKDMARLTTRSLSSNQWGDIEEAREQANYESRQIPAATVHKAGEAQIERVEKAMRGMEPDNEDFTVRREALAVHVDLTAGMGSYWVQYDKTLRQICLMSPRSGAFRYNLDVSSGKWLSEADRHDFEGMLTRDIIQQAYGIPNF